MECPKCGLEIDDKAMVCPNCKKVLKLACPICKTINTTNTCKSCGYVIVSKCHNCGKVNQTFAKKCRNCGFPTEKSVVMNEANSDDFVMITINFPNMSDMKNILGSAKLYNKFKVSVDKIIADYVKSVGLRRQVINGTYAIRCTRDYTFKGSASTAVKTVIELINRITAMNCKLTKKKNAAVRCNVFLLKRSINDDPNNTDSGYNISLLNQDAKSQGDKILSTFQVLSDADVSDVISGEYKVSPLNSIMVDDKMVMISEVDLKDLVTVEFPVDDDEDVVDIPNFVQNMLIEQDKLDGEALQSLNRHGEDPDAIYDIETITFDEIRCEFLRTENIDVIYHVMNKFQAVPKGIVAIKTMEMYKPYTLKLLNAAAETGQFNNIISITCYDEMKYSPYSFFRDLVSAIFEYTVSQKLFSQNDFSMFANVDPDGLIKDLVTLNKRNGENNEDTRYVYFDIFLTLLQVIPKTLIFIEDFEKIDSSSYDVLKYLFGAFEQLDISFLISYDQDFSLHKDCHFLLMKPYYTEIALKATSFEKMIEDNKIYYKNIMGDFYFQRIAKYACGSSLFIDIALQYLIESEVYRADDETVEMVNPKTIIIPSSLDKLVERRLNLLQDDADAMKFLTSIVLLGTRIDMGTINSLGYKDTDKLLEKLSDMGYLYEYNNCIYFPNYNLLRRNLLTSISPIYLKEVANELFEKTMDTEGMPSPIEAYLYSLLGETEKERHEWEELAEVNLSLGDFSAYVNCADRILKLLDVDPDPEKLEEIEAYKAQIYENISENLYEYVPTETSHIAETTLEHIEKTSDADKVIRLCNKMINGAIANGDYNHALELMHKVLALLPMSSINPSDPNFNVYFFLMSLMHVQILFNVGALKDCLEVGFRVFNVVSNDTIQYLKPDYFTDEAFKDLLVEIAGYVALADVILLIGNVQDFVKILREAFSDIPLSYDMFETLQEVLRNHEVAEPNIQIDENDKFGWILINLIQAYRYSKSDYNTFAEYVYKAKIAAKNARIYQLELIADLLIASAYMNSGSMEKAEHIIYNIIRTTSKNGMTTVLYLAWYAMSELHLMLNKFDVSFGIASNSLIQLEKNSNASEVILMLFKYNMYKIMMFKEQYERAEICLMHAQYLAQKYQINMDFDTDPNHYISMESADEPDLSVNPIEEVESEG